MKIKRKLAAALLSVITVFSLLPMGAAAADVDTSAEIKTPTTSAPAIDATHIASSTTGSLTISKEGSASTFAIYKLYSMTPNASTKMYTYGKNSDFSGVSLLDSDYSVVAKKSASDLAALTLALRTAISSNSSTLEIKGSKTDGDTLNSVAKQTATLKTVDPNDPNKSDYTTTFSNLELGYYLVIETATTGAKTASKDFLVSVPLVQSGAWSYGVTATCKDSTVPTGKTITNSLSDMTTTDLTGATRKIGDTVPYRLDAGVPQYDLKTVSNIQFILNDDLSTGLTYNKSVGVKVYGFNKGTTTASSANDITNDFTIDDQPDGSGGTNLTITCNGDNAFKDIVNKGYTSISAFYSATLNSSAVIGSQGNPNTLYLTYTTSPGKKTNSTHHTVYVYTFGLNVVKSDTKDSHHILPGAQFNLYKTLTGTGATAALSDQVGGTLTTDTNGNLTFTGLNDGTYYLKEIVAPAGYSLLDGYITVQITAVKVLGPDGKTYQPTGDFSWSYTPYNGATVEYKSSDKDAYIYVGQDKIDAALAVSDDSGFTLPGTGGIGTTIFFVSGIAILLLGGCMALVYTKKRKKTGGHFQH
jgi:fimbrial isopeptide formation D2 family protein/LPXTG-motif cell wall-anchored protein